MSAPVICVSDLSKRYLLQHQSGGGRAHGYRTIREEVRNWVAGLRAGRKKPEKSREAFWALKDVSFEVEQGGVVGIIGRNGAGKSTLLKIHRRIVEPTSGEVRLRGRVASLLEVGTGFHPELTGRENIYLNGAVLGMTRAEVRSKFDEIIDFAELGDYIDLPVRIYSSGMMTRLGFSIATSVEPEILLLDEGLATGDAHFAQKAERKLQELISRSSILVIASHSETLLANMCNRALLLEHGKVISDGDAKNLFDSYRNSVIESAQADDAEGLHRAYLLATDMAKRGERPSLALEEQGLRYALTIAPDDNSMWQRYVQVLMEQKKPVAADIEVRMMLAVLGVDRSRTELMLRIKEILVDENANLPDDLRQRAIAALG